MRLSPIFACSYFRWENRVALRRRSHFFSQRLPPAWCGRERYFKDAARLNHMLAADLALTDMLKN